MKKILRVLLLVFAFSIVSGCSQTSPADVQTKIDNEETFIVVASSTTCPKCLVYAPTVEEFAKQSDVEVITIEIDKLSEEERTSFATDYNIVGTPTTLFFVKGRLVGSLTGIKTVTELNDIITKFTK